MAFWRERREGRCKAPRQVWAACAKLRGAASKAFLRQLLWREFAHHLLYHFPQTACPPLRPQFHQFPWRRDPQGLRAWQRGRTATTTFNALGGASGTQLWSLSFSVPNLTKPVQGPDGRLFLVAGGYPARGDNQTTKAAQDAQLFIVDATKGTLIATVDLQGEMASAPMTSGSGTGYYVYLTVTTVTLANSEPQSGTNPSLDVRATSSGGPEGNPGP